ncbi:MAG: hypothetical protein JW802_09425 [Campylobacterales bacterium]|nr:hypothetical protein [Campylobacterales bacterium]MBN2832016.1 hypothetical protein [Campylobacterales bacterium]
MISKLVNLFKVKEDETLNYMDPDKLIKPKRELLYDPLAEDDEDAFFKELEAEKMERFEEVKQTKTQTPSRNSTLKKMAQCMKEREWNPKRNPKPFMVLFVILLCTFLISIVLHEVPNPLIGKWQPQKKSNIFIPTGDVEFRKEQILANGVITPIEYTIENTYIEVVDLQTKTRIRFDVKDEKTIELNLLGVKTTYKKVH